MYNSHTYYKCTVIVLYLQQHLYLRGNDIGCQMTVFKMQPTINAHISSVLCRIVAVLKHQLHSMPPSRDCHFLLLMHLIISSVLCHIVTVLKHQHETAIVWHFDFYMEIKQSVSHWHLLINHQATQKSVAICYKVTVETTEEEHNLRSISLHFKRRQSYDLKPSHRTKLY